MAIINNIIKRIIAVLKVPARIPQFITKSKNILSMMTNNANFPVPFPLNVPALAAVGTDITALETAQSAALTKAKGTAQARNVKRSIVLKDLIALQRYVQSVADANPSVAAAIIQSGGFDVKQSAQRVKPDFEARNGKVSGSVDLLAKSAGNRVSYEWQQSTDNVNWTMLPSTLQAKTTVNGLTAGSKLYFRFRAVLIKGESSWSQSVNIVVL